MVELLSHCIGAPHIAVYTDSNIWYNIKVRNTIDNPVELNQLIISLARRCVNSVNKNAFFYKLRKVFDVQ